MRNTRMMTSQPGVLTTFSAGIMRLLPVAAVLALALQVVVAAATLLGSIAPEAQAAGEPGLWATGGQFLSVALLPSLAQEAGDADLNPTLEFIRQMTALDVLFIMLWVGAIILGMVTGVIRQLILIISLIVGALVAAALAWPLSNWTGPFTGTDRNTALPSTYFFLVIICVAAVYIFAVRIYPETRLGQYFVIDRLGGAVLGFLSGLIAVSVLVGMLAVATTKEWPSMDGTRTSMRAQLTTTPFLPLIATTFPLVTQSIGNTLPLPLNEVCERCL